MLKQSLALHISRNFSHIFSRSLTLEFHFWVKSCCHVACHNFSLGIAECDAIEWFHLFYSSWIKSVLCFSLYPSKEFRILLQLVFLLEIFHFSIASLIVALVGCNCFKQSGFTLIKRLNAAAVEFLDDVPAKLSGYRLWYFTIGKSERCSLKFRDHHARTEPIQVSSTSCRAIIRVLCSKLFKISSAHQLFIQAINLLV